jgi:hypothetical protein
MSILSSLAKQHQTSDGAVTFHLMPYLTLAFDIAAGDLETERPRDKWANGEYVFCLCDTLTTDIEFADDLPALLEPLRVYWQARPVGVVERWRLFASIMSPAAIEAWWAAYEGTRDPLFNVGDDTDPEAGSAAQID